MYTNDNDVDTYHNGVDLALAAAPLVCFVCLASKRGVADKARVNLHLF